MQDRFLSTRNQTLEFAKRSRKNLEYIENAYANGADVHPVTQLTLSMLGLVVFPWGEKKLIEMAAKNKDLKALEDEGWPTWTITRDDYIGEPTANLFILIRHLRNGVAHGRVKYTSDSGKLENVTVFIEDRGKNSKTEKVKYWCAEIAGTDLRTFCMKFFDFIDVQIG